MAEFDFSGAFVSEDNVQDGDILTIISSPMPEEKESANEKVFDPKKNAMVAKKYMVLNIPVEINGKQKTYTPDSKTGMRFNKAFGKDYTTWIGKQFSVKIESYKAYGADKKRVAGYPIEAVKAQ